jgi:hypothetical protein
MTMSNRGWRKNVETGVFEPPKLEAQPGHEEIKDGYLVPTQEVPTIDPQPRPQMADIEHIDKPEPGQPAKTADTDTIREIIRSELKNSPGLVKEGIKTMSSRELRQMGLQTTAGRKKNGKVTNEQARAMSHISGGVIRDEGFIPSWPDWVHVLANQYAGREDVYANAYDIWEAGMSLRQDELTGEMAIKYPDADAVDAETHAQTAVM